MSAAVSPSSGRNPLQDLVRAVRIVSQRLRVVGLDVARCDGVDVDAVRGPLVRERLRQLRDPALARCVPGDVDPALEGEEGGDEDDLPCSALQHEPADLAGEHELRRQVHFQDLVPVLVAVLGRRASPNRSGVVDEHVDRRPGSERFDEVVDRSPIAEVGCVPTEDPSPLRDLAADGASVGLEVCADPDHVCARICERDRDRLADAATAARDEHGRARERAGGHARQSMRIFMAAASPSSSSNTEGSRSSGSTALIRRSSGSAPAARRSIALS